jgi:TRAP-type mannitol/chloroaromatic compound transport system permease large subunit
MRYLFGPIRGGIAVAVVVVSTLFGACTGIIGASVVTMGLLAMPVLLKYGYNKKLSCGCICAGGTLGILIPPSIMLVVMADQGSVSVGKLFAGAVIPGLILSGLYIALHSDPMLFQTPGRAGHFQRRTGGRHQRAKSP